MPRRPDLERFDWDAEEAATKHGFTVFQIEDAFFDPGRRVLRAPSANRSGEGYARYDRRAMLARVKPDGPLLHIVYVLSGAKIKPFHARAMTEMERRVYFGKRG